MTSNVSVPLIFMLLLSPFSLSLILFWTLRAHVLSPPLSVWRTEPSTDMQSPCYTETTSSNHRSQTDSFEMFVYLWDIMDGWIGREIPHEWQLKNTAYIHFLSYNTSFDKRHIQPVRWPLREVICVCEKASKIQTSNKQGRWMGGESAACEEWEEKWGGMGVSFGNYHYYMNDGGWLWWREDK